SESITVLEHLTLNSTFPISATETQETQKYYATFFSSTWAYTVPSGVTAYLGAIGEDETIIRTKITDGLIPAGVPVILESGTGSYNLTAHDCVTGVSGENDLIGTDVEITEIPENSYYFNNGDKFSSASGISSIAANTAYLISETAPELTYFPLGEVLILQFDLEVTDLGWASIYYDKALKIPGGVKVYFANTIDGDDVTLKQVIGNIPANTGVIVKANPGIVTFPFAEGDVPAIEDTNLFKGLLADKLCSEVTEDEGKKIYTLAGKESDGTLLFMLYDTSLDLHANRIYMPLAGNSEIKYLRIADDDDATGIDAFRSTNAYSRAVNLMGIPVDDTYSGIILKDGKKVLRVRR
ncbi:MAG: hypothetical protein Q4A08_09760, partial [Bacteroidales bacterium]|nr:hypothetical protein [Bacteroidales bacterium]